MKKAPFTLIYGDEDMIAVNKAAGLLVAADRWDIEAPRLDLLIQKELPKIDPLCQKLYAVHRIDKDTSGILITARSAESEAFLKNEFKLRHTEKYYLAILTGVPEKQSGIIETSVFRDGHSRIRFAASADLSKGKYACSRYKVLRVYGRYALVLFKIDTGRTHQIRLHARFIGCPIVGDPLYGKKEAEWKPYGMMLHAYRLCVALPSTREKAVFTAPPPRKFRTVLRLLQTQGNG